MEVKMNISKKTLRLTSLGLLTAISLIFAFTPLGYIPIPPIAVTLMSIPVLIGALALGFKEGIFLGFVFGASSFLQIFYRPTPLGTLLFSVSPLKTIIVLFIPRLLIPIFAYLIFKALTNKEIVSKSKKRLAFAVSALTGSITNTLFFLSTLYFLYLPQIDTMASAFATTPDKLAGVLAVIGLTNGVPEAIVVTIIVTGVCSALFTRNKIKARSS